MKAKNKIRKWTEPLMYVVLVAAFGFVTTVVNKNNTADQIQNTDFVTLTLESELEAMFYQDEAGVSL